MEISGGGGGGVGISGLFVIALSFDMKDLHLELVSKSSSYEFKPSPKFHNFVYMISCTGSCLQINAEGRNSPWIIPFSCKN